MKVWELMRKLSELPAGAEVLVTDMLGERNHQITDIVETDNLEEYAFIQVTRAKHTE